MDLSAIVITKNAAGKLSGCLKSLEFVDETIVVDAGSTDETILIAEKNKARVIQTVDKGFAESRNIGAKTAKGEWLFYVDSDERVPVVLKEEIIKKINNYSGYNSYKIYRKNIILGKWLRHGGWWPDPVHRLIKKSALKGWEGKLLHEYPVVSGQMGLIKEPIIHLSKDSISEMVMNSRIFAPIEAKLWFDSAHPPVRIYHFILAMWREFWQRGIVKAGWLDGWVGVFEVMYQMWHQALVYSILWEKQRKAK